MTDIKFDPKNYRIHGPANKELIKKSLAELGAGRSILIDGEGYIVAGNGVFEKAEELGIPVKVIETDGTELIAVKRTDLKLDDERRRELALADNATSDSSVFDFELLAEDWSQEGLEKWGVDLPEWTSGFSDKNKEINIDDLGENVVIKLEYPFDEYERVRDGLLRIAPTLEAAVWNLLGFEDE